MEQWQRFLHINMFVEADINLKVFNSDIILGKFNKEIDSRFANKLAQVLLSVFEDHTMTFVIGRDTRESAFEIEKTLTRVLKTLGVNVFLLGVTSSPAVSFAVRAYQATAGIMITASSRTEEYIGFKIFNGNGFKISDEQLTAIEYKYKNLCQINPKNKEGNLFYKPYFNDEYINFLKQFCHFHKTNNFKILADLTCGSAEEIYEEFCYSVGISDFLASESFDCEKINKTYLSALSRKSPQKFIKTNYDGTTTQTKDFFDYKIVFDGDCDKLLIFDKKGKQIDQDVLLAMFALAKKQQGEQFCLVTTLYTNNAILDFLKKKEIHYHILNDSISQKKLIHHMLATKSELGGDKFGNLIFLDKCKTSDSFLTLIEFLNCLSLYPSLVYEVLNIKLVEYQFNNYSIKDNFDFESFQNLISACESSLENYGKILVKMDKILNQIQVYIECDNKDLKNEIIKTINHFMK